jgi:hypothetical protein
MLSRIKSYPLIVADCISSGETLSSYPVLDPSRRRKIANRLVSLVRKRYSRRGSRVSKNSYAILDPVVFAELHRKGASSLGQRPEGGRVSEHF